MIFLSRTEQLKSFCSQLVTTFCWSYIFKFPEIELIGDEEYIPREDSKEWDAVGLMGKLYIIDDGTCEAYEFEKVGAEGELTTSNVPTNVQVIERVASNSVRVFIK